MSLTQEQVRKFHNQGYLVVENVFADKDLSPVIDAIDDFVDRRALTLKGQGKIYNLCADQPFERRYASLYMQSDEIRQGLDIMYSRLPAIFAFLHNDHLLDVVTSLLGDELTCSPILHLRAKLPIMLGTLMPDYYFQNVSWHQDAVVTLEEADPVNIYTFWIPLVNALEDTGCMELMPGAFKLGLFPHWRQGDTTIIPAHLPNLPVQPIPCRKGGMVIMNKYTPHRGTQNVSNIVRWSIDLRFQQTGTPTGRPFHPALIVRSRAHPESVQNDYNEWCSMWDEALKTSRGLRAHRI